MEVNEKLYNEIVQYCNLNNISDSEKFINNLLRKAFTREKFSSNEDVEKEENTKEGLVKTEIIIKDESKENIQIKIEKTPSIIKNNDIDLGKLLKESDNEEDIYS